MNQTYYIDYWWQAKSEAITKRINTIYLTDCRENVAIAS
jgi:hypothetical protein